ncbi:MAG: CRISPR-associated endonuclease Cas1 [Thermodesulfobacteriota bacterium]|nr:CRISPR-associated endonuclease Cas1 [Thermodesulfobacteriota bacterium]
MVIYIKTQGARIIREGRHLLVKKGDSTCHTLFTYKLKQVVVFGNIEITHGALCQLMKNNIDTVYLTRYGRYLGRLAPEESKNVFLRKKQYQLLDDADAGLCLARAIVAGKLANMATLLMRIKRTKKAKAAGQWAEQIQHLGKKLETAATVDSLRGLEGKASALYFQGLRHGFTENLGFTKRVRRPPTDPVNSVLSLLYTFLMNRVYAAVRVAGLDPYPGFLHAIDYGRYSLVLDLMEEFRPIIADTLTLSLFNLKILKPADFRTEVPPPAAKAGGMDCMPDVAADPLGQMSMTGAGADTAGTFDLPEQRMAETPVGEEDVSPGKYPVKLNPDAMQAVIEAFEKKLTTRFHHPPAERSLSYQDALFFQAGQYRRVIEGEAKTYLPLLLK